MNKDKFPNYPYVEPDIAKLALEFGFDWKCTHFYYAENPNEELELKYTVYGGELYILDFNSDRDEIETDEVQFSAPTYQQVIDWLREEYSLNIRIQKALKTKDWWWSIEMIENFLEPDNKILRHGNHTHSDEYYDCVVESLKKAFEIIKK